MSNSYVSICKAGASDLWKTAGLGTSRNANQNCYIGQQQKHTRQNCRIGHQQKHFRQYCWNHKLHIVGKLQGLRPCNFQWNSWKLGTSISFLLWENCRGFAPAIFRGTLGNQEGATISFILWENCRGAPAIFRGTLGNWGHPYAYYGNSWELGEP